jgi:hypothetical protein
MRKLLIKQEGGQVNIKYIRHWQYYGDGIILTRRKIADELAPKSKQIYQDGLIKI